MEISGTDVDKVVNRATGEKHYIPVVFVGIPAMRVRLEKTFKRRRDAEAFATEAKAAQTEEVNTSEGLAAILVDELLDVSEPAMASSQAA